MNYKFSIDEWLPRFPLEASYGRYSADFVTGPRHICNNEQLRREMQDQFDWGPAVPVDVFIMADGEPEDRSATKIGGLPYRSTDRKWPKTPDGSPMFFLAQFNFGDSQDLVGDLPGDLLLVFGDNSNGPFEPLHFEWQDVGLTNLVPRENIPVHPFQFAPCYGHIFRTLSFPRAQETVSSNSKKHPTCRGLEVWSSFHIPQYQATQIGEAPFLIQPEDSDHPGRILCTISSVGVNPHQPYAFINRPEPLMPEGKWDWDTYLSIWDSGCIYISIDEDKKLHYAESCS